MPTRISLRRVEEPPRASSWPYPVRWPNFSRMRRRLENAPLLVGLKPRSKCSNQSFGRGASSYLCAVPRPTDQPLTTLSASKHDRPTDQRAVVGDFGWQLSKNPAAQARCAMLPLLHVCSGHPRPRPRRRVTLEDHTAFRCPSGAFLEERGLVDRTPRLQRHVRQALARGLLPSLEDASTRQSQNATLFYTHESLPVAEARRLPHAPAASLRGEPALLRDPAVWQRAKDQPGLRPPRHRVPSGMEGGELLARVFFLLQHVGAAVGKRRLGARPRCRCGAPLAVTPPHPPSMGAAEMLGC